MSTSEAAKARIMTDYKGLQKEKWCNIELQGDSLFKWTVGLMVINKDSYYDGGYFKTEMVFPPTYPYSPPSFRFLRPIFHPNIYPDGRACISILHPPGDDIMSGESANERWSVLQGAESVLRSILLLLDDPEISSPANVDASVMYRDNREAFKKKAAEDVEKSKADIPAGFVLPTSLEEAPPAKIEDDHDFWADSDAEDDFGASNSSGDDIDMDDFEDDDDDDEGDLENESDEN